MMKRRISAFAVAGLAVAGTLAFASPALADGGSNSDPWKVAHSVPAVAPLGIHTLALQTRSGEKAGAVQPYDTIGGSGTLADSKSINIHPTGGGNAPLTTGYHTTVGVNLTSATFTGTSYGKWLGATPVNATKLTLSDALSVAAVSSVSISVPAGAGFSVGSNSVTLTTSVNNNWQLTHSFHNVVFTGGLLSQTEDSSVTATFGTQTFFLFN